MGERQRAAIVTGGGRGIGRAVASRLLADGFAVMLAEIDAELGRKAAAALADHGPVACIETDVGDEGSVEAAVRATLERFGGLDAVVNNAGISRNRPVTELPAEDWHRVLDVNLSATFYMAKHAAKALGERQGAMVNIASTRALMSEPNTIAYSASKAGLVGLTHALAISLGPAVRVNCISPGWIDTREGEDGDPAPLREVDHAQHPAGRVGRPQDVAELALFLATPRSGFVTGQNFVIDGGMTKKMIYEH